MAVFEIDWERFAPQRAIVGGLIVSFESHSRHRTSSLRLGPL